ncbi:MAG: hypothetical protein U9P90_02415, partial [Patescibacteria group bacterium]|nr:hypothetical protein [Patescibacteria group bacterium]
KRREKMTKTINILFNEDTGEFFVDMSGFEGELCRSELVKIAKLLREEGIDVEFGDVKKKPPQIPISNKQTEKIERSR